jgi:CubicO group peptidase (beta-lactamase class C family)
MKFKLFTLFTLLTLALAVWGTAQAAQPSNPDEASQRFDTLIPSLLRRYNVPGVAVALVDDGEMAWAQGYGLADPAQGIPVSPKTGFEAASVSKPVSAWGVMKLVEAGQLDLDAPIEHYLTRWHLPPSEFDHDQVTIRRILSHSAGLSGVAGDPGVEPGEPLPTLEEALSGAIKSMGDVRVVHQPGEEYHYSSKSYTLLELAIEEVTGESFVDYMQREILEPLGMVNSTYDWTLALRSREAVGYDWGNRPLPYYQYATHAQASLYTTAPDLARFIAATMSGPNGEPVGRGVLTPESVAEILTVVPITGESSEGIGLGYDLSQGDGTLIARKTGDNRGWKPIIFLLPERGEGIAIMTNSDRAHIGFLIEIACAWSEGLSGNPLQATCSELKMIRNGQYAIAAVLGLGLLAYAGWVAVGIRAGRRRLGWVFSWGKGVRIALLLVGLVLWWILWHTDTLLRILGFVDTYVTVRIYVPWPTAFIWISWAATLWLLALIAASFAPKGKQQSPTEASVA